MFAPSCRIKPYFDINENKCLKYFQHKLFHVYVNVHFTLLRVVTLVSQIIIYTVNPVLM